jgi:hypothetical protein
MLTDTRFTWELSKHIFRYGHGSEGLGNIHTVDEREWLVACLFLLSLSLSLDSILLSSIFLSNFADSGWCGL